MSSTLMKVAGFLPSVREPEKEQSLKEMLSWTGVVLLLYFILGSINIYGADSQAVAQALTQLETMQTILGAQIGTIITLGISPIVTSSIVLQMLVGSELLNWNTNTQQGKQKFQAAQKVLAYLLAVLTGFGYAMGVFGVGMNTPGTLAVVGSQIALGGMLIILMDDLVQKWGFGSGVGIFIAAGVSKAVYITAISPLAQGGSPAPLFWTVGGTPVGQIFKATQTTSLAGMFSEFLPVIMTAAVFLTVVYLQAMRVEIPLTLGNTRGFGQKWPLKFLYTSNMPVILIAAAVSNIRILGTTLTAAGSSSIFGTLSADGQFTSGLVSWLSPPTQIIDSLLTVGFTAITPIDIFHVIFYTAIYVVGSTVFSIFWMKTSGQDADSVAQQIHDTGMKVPGFRRDTRVIKKVLNRYIPGLTILSGAVVGLLAAVANMTGAAGGGTGILLTVMILYRLYEQLAQKHMEELHPALKDFMGAS
ncbi:preprotein translocase subunit SecY [Candidatus Nanohalococcus occultus]|uniref:Protein translocase subunit SecY n=1 Tax=Candidatus Nanohalococcus occultus TaxID=2978047 RepID=A0ABY8CKR1_9ARCH|nr:Preprotein translocase subunit SecY [Candidatus Nanohaloarchaeota archaeon SVXNc]